MKSKSLKAALIKFNAEKKENPADFEILNQKEVGAIKGGKCNCYQSTYIVKAAAEYYNPA